VCTLLQRLFCGSSTTSTWSLWLLVFVCRIKGKMIDEVWLVVSEMDVTPSLRAHLATAQVLVRSPAQTLFDERMCLMQVLTIKNSDIAKHLSLPPVKLHCSMVRFEACVLCCHWRPAIWLVCCPS
jgi:NifU-like protein involved in Fe-S cluster formation